jgi:opacity protein-like surface antigen
MKTARLLLAPCCILALIGTAAAAAPDNAVSIAQAGPVTPSGGNVSVIIQQGSNNYAESDQTGGFNTDAIEQFGNDNSSTVVQKSVDGIVVDTQLGNGNKFSVTQTGIDPPPVIIVQHH